MKSLLDFFSPPVFPEDEEKTRTAYYLNAIVLSAIAIIAAFLFLILSGYDEEAPHVPSILIGIIITLVVTFLLEKNSYIKAASYLFILMAWSATTLLAINGNGVKDAAAECSYLVVIALAALILGYQAGLWLTGLSILSLFALAYGNSSGLIAPKYEEPFSVAIQVTVLLIFGALFIYLSINNLQKAIKQAKERSQDLEKSNKELQELDKSLEAKVAERTDDLFKANIENKRRATQFQTVTQIAQKITSERDLDTLLSIIAELISSQFNYYHVAIYLNDDIQEYTILSAASSEEGKRMMGHGYKLPVNTTSLIGYVAKTGNSRSSADTADEIYISGAELIATRSEFAMPLKAGVQIIGVLDVQSEKENAFDQTDIEALTALANQITIAIQNTRLFAETQTAMAESQLLYGAVIKQTWKSVMQSSPQIGYRYTGVKPVALQKEIDTPEIRSALENDDFSVTQPSRRKTENALAVPLKLRESTIGIINVNFPIEAEIGEDEIDVILAASERIALALENASLLEESQRRAKREQTISEMSAKIGAGTEVETILKTAIQELSSHISSAQITIELESEELEKG
jgi:GAF domain-containing protein